MHSVKRSSKGVSPMGETSRTSTVRMANLLHTKECPEYGHSSSGFKPQSGCYVGAEAAGYELVERYLDGLLPELNFRLFCDMELEDKF